MIRDLSGAALVLLMTIQLAAPHGATLFYCEIDGQLHGAPCAEAQPSDCCCDCESEPADGPGVCGDGCCVPEMTLWHHAPNATREDGPERPLPMPVALPTVRPVIAPMVVQAIGGSGLSQPPPPPVRRHLLHCVQLC